MKFPADAPKARVLRALRSLGFEIVREKEHISLLRQNRDGSGTPLTMPNHSTLKRVDPPRDLYAVWNFAGRLHESLPPQLIAPHSAFRDPQFLIPISYFFLLNSSFLTLAL